MQHKTVYTVRVLCGTRDIGVVKDTNKQRALATAKRSYRHIENFDKFEFVISEEPINTFSVSHTNVEGK